MAASLTGLGSKNVCAGEGQQQLQMTDQSFHRRCYIDAMTVGVHLSKKSSGRESEGSSHQDE
jgi:hypothetical protein